MPFKPVRNPAVIDSRDPDDYEQALLRAMASGDRSALRQLYGLYHPRLSRFLGRMCAQDAVVEEAINDCFMIVWRKAGEFRAESQVSTWIMGIARRCALKCLRAQEQAAQAMDPAQLEQEPLASDDEHPLRERREWIAKGLALLPAEQRLAIELAYFGGHSGEEIAAIMDCPLSTVKARLFQARLKLRNLLPGLAGESHAE